MSLAAVWRVVTHSCRPLERAIRIGFRRHKEFALFMISGVDYLDVCARPVSYVLSKYHKSKRTPTGLH